jgi:hypothetical protein
MNQSSQKNLKPFKPGQSGNPTGRPVGVQNYLRKKFGREAKPLVDELAKLALTERNPKIRLEALTLALAYHSGRPPQGLELSADPNLKLQITIDDG